MLVRLIVGGAIACSLIATNAVALADDRDPADQHSVGDEIAEMARLW